MENQTPKPTILIIPQVIQTLTILPLQTAYFQTLIASIKNASTTIKICQYVFSATGSRAWQRSEKVYQELIAAATRGVSISLLIDRPRPRSPNSAANIKTARRLQVPGITTRCLSLKTTLHLKLIIIDNAGIFTGSHNLTNSSLYSPLELSFFTTSATLVTEAQIFFKSLWDSPMSQIFSPTKTLEKTINAPG